MNFAAGYTDWKRNFYYILGIALILTIAFSIVVSTVQAQSPNSWSDPVNLSQSGSASDPVVMVDSDGLIHILWKDEFAGLVYAFGEGTEWSIPTPVVLPAEEAIPFLIADSDGNFHALWRDIDNRLFYSRGTASAFLSSTNWSPSTLISESVLDFEVALDENGDLHLAYVNPVETETSPAGIYYQRLVNGTSNWLTPNLIYDSPYFRSLDLANSNVDITTTGEEDDTRIFVAWDNRLRERVYLARSDDHGQTWISQEEIDQPKPGIVGSGPSNILVYAEGEEVMLLWRVGEQESNCNQYYQWSQDRGETWSLQQPIISSAPICLEEVQMVSGAEHPVMMGEADQVYFLAWDGTRWSLPQIQAPLTNFIDVDTQNPVLLGCRQLIQNESNTLYVVGCDQELGGDIWVMKRLLFDFDASFPVESGWSTLDNIESFEVKIGSPKIKNDELDRAHLFWSQAENIANESLGKSIYYTVRQDGQWSPTSEILSSPFGKAEQIDLAVDLANHLFVVWSGGFGGEIFFSQADASQAFVASSWSEPIALPSPLPVGSAPDIMVDQNQVIYVTYAIPLNEKRGIFLTKSDDSGQTWTDPILVFDAQSAGWDMIDNPYLALTQNGDLHLIWTRYSLPSGEGPLELHYSKSEDEGVSWAIPEMVVAGPVVWSQILAPENDTVQRLWQQDSSSGSTLWHEQSIDSGITWERVAPVSIFGEIVGDPSVSSDEAGHLHLILMVRSGVGTYFLQHWVYDGQSWTSEPNQNLQFSSVTEFGSIVSDFSQDWYLDVVLLDRDFTMDGNEQYHLLFTYQAMEDPELGADQVIQITPTQDPVIAPIPTIRAPEPSPTVIEITETPINFPVEPGNLGNSDWIVIAGPVAIGLIALVVIIFVVRWIRR
ncbi:MAG: exo-alpha-sialidase [Chloroflexi bacterium]|nr:exo-alpha-sialidase [Chloroflexota bacterium]